MKKYMFLFVALLVAQAAQAQEPGKFYVFGQLGAAKVDIDQAGNDAALRSAGATGLSSTVTDTAGAVMIGAGFRFVPHASIEVGYLATSDFEYKATFAQGTASEKDSGHAFGLNVAGYLPVAEKIELYGKLGIWSVHVDDTVTISAAGFLQQSASSSNTTPMIGLGVDFKITPQLSARLEYDHFTKVGDDSTIGSSKLDFASGGIAVSF